MALVKDLRYDFMMLLLGRSLVTDSLLPAEGFQVIDKGSDQVPDPRVEETFVGVFHKLLVEYRLFYLIRLMSLKPALVATSELEFPGLGGTIYARISLGEA